MKDRLYKSAIVFAVSVLGLVAVPLANNHPVLKLGAEQQEPFTLVLDSDDAPTNETEVQEEIEASAIDNVHANFRYKKVLAAENALCALEAGGSIEKIDAAYDISSIAVNFVSYNLSQDIYLATKTNADDDYNGYVRLSSEVPVEFKGNYFKLVTVNGVTINSITIEYNCENELTENTFNIQHLGKKTKGDSEVWAFLQTSVTKSMADISDNGTYQLNAIETDQSFWGYKNSVHDTIQTKENGFDIGNALSTAGILGIGTLKSKDSTEKKTSVMAVFPFTLDAPATVKTNLRLSGPTGVNLNSRITAGNTQNLSCWVSLDSQYLAAPNVAFADWPVYKDCNYGTHYLGAGNHVFMIEIFKTASPNIDCLQLIVSNYGGEAPVDYSPITDGTKTFYGIESYGPGRGIQSFDAAFIGVNGNLDVTHGSFTNNPAEGYSSAQTSVANTNTAGLRESSSFTFRINVPEGGANVTPKGYYATKAATGVTIDLHDYARLYIDGEDKDNSNFSNVTFNENSGWTDYKEFSYGTYYLEKGIHTITFALDKSFNINKFTITADVKNAVTTLPASSQTVYLRADSLDSTIIDTSNLVLRNDITDGKYYEYWSTSHTTEIGETSGYCLRGLVVGSVIELPFVVTSNINLSFGTALAYNENSTASALVDITIDGVEIPSINDDKAIGPKGTANNGEKYWNWKVYTMNFVAVEPGLHIIRITTKAAINIQDYRFTWNQ